MRILILTLGSQGDVQPYVALAKGLKSKKHNVAICTSLHFKAFIKTHDIEYQFMNNGFVELINHQSSKTILDGASNFFQKVYSLFTVLSLSKKLMKEIFVDTWQAAKNTKPDVIIAHPKVLSANHIAEKLDIPIIIVSPIPTFEPTLEFPLVGLPAFSFLTPSQAKWYNKVSYKLTKKAHHAFDKSINVFRKEQLDLPPCNPASSPLTDHHNQPIVHLHVFSPEVLPKPKDWREQAHVTGYLFLNNTTSWQPPQHLNDFLLAGDAPIYIGFGSMVGGNAKQLGHLILQAVTKANCRVIIAKGWGGVEFDDQEVNDGELNHSKTSSGEIKNICIIDSAPHDWLFPQVSAVVHHGGAGSTAAGLKAGKPTLICPFSMDQPFWGKRVENLMVGLPAIHQRKLTVNNLAEALIELTSNQLIKSNAKAMGIKISAENGVQQAVDIIEKALS